MHGYHIELARHALGLTKGRTVSFRMHFVAGKGHHDHAAWMEMVAAEDATRVDGAKLHYGGDDLFLLTQKGAEKALRPGEELSEEDFPNWKPK